MAGMLSISSSSRFSAAPRTFGLASEPAQAQDAPRPAARKARATPQELPLEEDVIKEVHRDDEYGQYNDIQQHAERH